MGDSADTAVDKIANLNEQMKEYDDNIKHIRSGLQGIFANHGIEIDLNNMNPDEIAQQLVTAMDDDTFASELTEEEGKTIRDYISKLMDNTKKLEESFDQVFETVKEGYDQWNERLQDQMSEYARLNKIVSSYKDLVSLTGKDAFGLSYDELNK
jgi:predicted nuclease with TOPRIM domain